VKRAELERGLPEDIVAAVEAHDGDLEWWEDYWVAVDFNSDLLRDILNDEARLLALDA
jgi:hypothetical protein